MHNTLSFRFARHGALLLLAGLLTGGVLNRLPDHHLGNAAHVTALIGGFGLIGVGWIWPHLRLGPTSSRLGAWTFIVAMHLNWLGLVLAAFHPPAPDQSTISALAVDSGGVLVLAGILSVIAALVLLAGLQPGLKKPNTTPAIPSSFTLKIIRLGFTLLQFITPRFAGRVAFYLFCRTPSVRPKGKRAKATHAAGEAWLTRAERIELHLDGGGQALAYRINGGAHVNQPRYLVTHGWASGMHYMTAVLAMLAETGAEVIGLDFPGHGEAGGKTFQMLLAVKSIAAAKERFGEFDAAIGHSLGGAALIVSAAGILSKPLSVRKIVTIGSLSEMESLFSEFGAAIGLKPTAQLALEDEVKLVTGRVLADFDVGTAAGRIDAEILVIHSEDDKEFSASHARRYATSGENVRLFMTNGFGHRRILEAPPVLSAIGAFVVANSTKDL